MKTIESAIHSTDGYITSFSRNTEDGWWELEVGLPKTWVFDENDNIGCELTFEYENGKIVRIYPKNDTIVIDDLVAFTDIIIKINARIAEKEEQFTNMMQEMKDALENKAKNFYKELDELKETSFNSAVDEVTETKKEIVEEISQDEINNKISQDEINEQEEKSQSVEEINEQEEKSGSTKPLKYQVDLKK